MSSRLVPDIEPVGDLLADREMRELITFNLEDGRIWMDDRRVTLQEVSVFSTFRAKLIESIGLQATRVFMERVGYQTGLRDAALYHRRFPDGRLQHRPRTLHSFQGICRVETIEAQRNVEGNFIEWGSWIYHDCAEADAHIEAFGIGTDVACWMEVGYASGYTTGLWGQPFWVRETSCRAMGSQVCHVVGHYLPPESAELKQFKSYYLGSAVPTQAREAAPVLKPEVPGTDHKLANVIIGRSASLQEAFHLLHAVAKTNASVLITGESGVGKELFTRNLHRLSKRADKPFIAINCAAIPETLIESELFGADRGAFTGAVQARAGRFERAHGGTIFLDEISSLNHVAQAKLLRVLQEGELERVGGTKVIPVDVRVIAATNVSLKEAVRLGHFRDDLFFRLNVFPIHLPPLRERRDDIPALLAHYLARFNELHEKTVPGFTFDATQMLLNYRFPGNVRELENLVERAVILAGDVPIDHSHLFAGGEILASNLWTLGREGKIVKRANADTRASDMGRRAQTLTGALMLDFEADGPLHWPELEKSLFEKIARKAIDHANGNISEASRMLGMERHQFAYRLKQINEK